MEEHDLAGQLNMKLLSNWVLLVLCILKYRIALIRVPSRNRPLQLRKNFLKLSKASMNVQKMHSLSVMRTVFQVKMIIRNLFNMEKSRKGPEEEHFTAVI